MFHFFFLASETQIIAGNRGTYPRDFITMSAPSTTD